MKKKILRGAEYLQPTSNNKLLVLKAKRKAKENKLNIEELRKKYETLRNEFYKAQEQAENA